MGKGTSKQSSFPGKHEYFDQMIINPASNESKCLVTVQGTTMLTNWASNLLTLNQIHLNTPSYEFMLVPLKFKEVSSNYCGKYSKVEITYDCYYMNFKDEIQQRKNQSCHFDQSSLWYLLLTLVQTASGLHQLGVKVGDIKPDNILLNNDGKAKIITALSLPKKIDAFVLYDEKSCHSLLSPEELQTLKKSYHENKNNYMQSQSFSIGMLILLAGNLIDSSLIYDYRQKMLNMVQFNRQLQFWQSFQYYDSGSGNDIDIDININIDVAQHGHGHGHLNGHKPKEAIRYSSALKLIVTKMLTIDPIKRLNSLQLYSVLQNYKKKIMNLQQFQVSLDEIDNLENASIVRQLKLKPHQKQYNSGTGNSNSHNKKQKQKQKTNIHQLRSSKHKYKPIINLASNEFNSHSHSNKKKNETFNQSFSFNNYNQHNNISFLSFNNNNNTSFLSHNNNSNNNNYNYNETSIILNNSIHNNSSHDNRSRDRDRQNRENRDREMKLQEQELLHRFNMIELNSRRQENGGKSPIAGLEQELKDRHKIETTPSRKRKLSTTAKLRSSQIESDIS